MARPHVAIIGGGPAGLMAADAASAWADVVLYEANKAVGRKFLVAGQGGFNITNSVGGADLKAHYTPPGFLDAALDDLGSGALRAWLADIGIKTHVGSSGRVFPLRGTKPVTVLQAILARLAARDVVLRTEHRFTGFTADARPILDHHGTTITPEADHYVFALGGASWPVTGSTGGWLDAFQQLGVRTAPFGASNCGVHIPWPANVMQPHAGKPLKNIAVSAGGHTVRGEATITAHGLEGNAVYPVVPALRAGLATAGRATLTVDLRPDLSVQQLLGRLVHVPRKEFVAALHLDRPTAALVKAHTTQEDFFDPLGLAQAIKALPLSVTALRPIEEAISSVGGIAPGELDARFALRRHPHLFVIGEMVDWDAPTGGFLLQGCFAMGRYAMGTPP